MQKIMVETNIFIYDLDENITFHDRCSKLLKNPECIFFTSTKNISEFFSVCSNLKFENGKVWQYYVDIRNNCNLLYPDEKSMDFFESLISTYKPSGNRFYDIEIVSIMLANNIREIATINKKDFQHIKEISLFEF